ncbi:hypothetical protein [Aureispira anguillae]|uniref:Uncharacterized protein n=1 Tax=Aureispira anguillae TaxID=2864201 RepID=A0A916DVT3_9BACT|nr:hypothetical protein [Aureispira anguillae]BDS14721.1 hypothetical protein AsAng_0055020 [Aureispira anguillae]
MQNSHILVDEIITKKKELLDLPDKIALYKMRVQLLEKDKLSFGTRLSPEEQKQKAELLELIKTLDLMETRLSKQKIQATNLINQHNGSLNNGEIEKLKEVHEGLTKIGHDLEFALKKGFSKINGFYNNVLKNPDQNSILDSISRRYTELEKLYTFHFRLLNDSMDVSQRENVVNRLLELSKEMSKLDNEILALRDRDQVFIKKQFSNGRYIVSTMFAAVVLTVGLFLTLSHNSNEPNIGSVLVGYGLIGLGINLRMENTNDSKNDN